MLFNKVRSAGRGCRVFSSDARIQVEAAGRYVYSDTAVVCPDVKEDEATDALLNPLVVVEVLSPSSEIYDRGVKFNYYRKLRSLRDYVLVSQDTPQVEVRSQASAVNRWQFQFAEGLDATFELPSLEITVNLADLYYGIDFDA